MTARGPLLALLCLLLVAVFSQGQREIRIAVGPSSGTLMRDLFSKVYSEAGYKASFIELPSLRQIGEFENGGVDSILFISEEALRSQIARGIPVGIGSGPLFEYKFLAYVLRSRAGELGARGDFRNLRIGFMRASPTQEGMIIRLGAVPVSITGMSSAVLMLAGDRIDILMAVPQAPKDALAANRMGDKILALSAPLIHVRYWHVVSQEMKDIIPSLSKALQAHEADFEALTGS